MLVLRNGHIIRGQVAWAGDLYYVSVPNGELRFRAADVEFVCRDLQQGYLRKRDAIRVGEVEDHLRLAQWCLRHGLLGPAGRELGDAGRADPTHPAIDLFRRRLELAVERPPVPSTSPPSGESAQEASSPAEKPPSPDRLRRLARDLPPGTVETFTQKIQPLLLNHCSAAACHGSGSGAELRLLRVARGAAASPLVTQRNLHSVLRWIDRREPGKSRLLIEPSQPHGGAKTPVFAKPQAESYRRLVAWVRQLGEQPEPDASQRASESFDSLDSELCPEKPRAGTMGGSPAIADEESSAADKQPYRPQYGNPLPGYVPVDPFDPEIFNRRFGLGTEIPGRRSLLTR